MLNFYFYFLKVPLIIGIPTVYRVYKNKTAFYLDKTLESLTKPLGQSDRKEVHILVILADKDVEKQQHIYKKLKRIFSDEIQNGLISIIGIPDRFYLQLDNLKQTFKDSQDRMYWRSKQSLDYTFIFQYVQNLCDYYLQIEDDVLADDQYYTTIMDDIERLDHVRNKRKVLFPDDNSRLKFKPWIVSEYYKMGFIGRLIPSRYLPLLSGFIRALYKEIPVDWGYPHLLGLTGGLNAIANPPLFTHIGNQSSSLGT